MDDAVNATDAEHDASTMAVHTVSSLLARSA